MAKLAIPSSEYAVLLKLATAEEGAVKALASALQEIEPEIVDLDLSSLLSKRVPSISEPDLRGLVRTLGAINAIREDRQRSPEAIADDIKETIVANERRDFDAEKIERLRERLIRLLSAGGAISLVAKTMSVITSQESVFCGAKVLSDMRPIFLTSPEKVSAAVVIHTLNISYHQGTQHKEFFVAMNPSDLVALKEVIERAEKKSQAIKAHVEKSGIRYLENTG